MMTNASRRVDYDDLLDLDVAPANDVGDREPRLRSLSRWALTAAISLESEDTLYAGLSYDVSVGGIFVATIDTPPIGARVDLMVSLPDGREHALSGVVRWIRDAELASEGLPPGCGIEWKGLPVDALRTIEELAKVREPILWLPEAAQ
jgi:Tfp pilus assembly protein PilZ